MKRWIPLSMFAACVVLVIVLCRFLPVGRVLHRPISYLGLLPAMAGAAMGILGLSGLARARTTTAAFGRPSRLVTAGIYRWTRNPIYLGLTLMLGGICLLSGAHCLLIPAGIFWFVVDRWIVRREERAMHSAFGQAYDAYRTRTPRWV